MKNKTTLKYSSVLFLSSVLVFFLVPLIADIYYGFYHVPDKHFIFRANETDKTMFRVILNTKIYSLLIGSVSFVLIIFFAILNYSEKKETGNIDRTKRSTE